ncbi:MAG: hypothetical protein ACTSX7_18430 [Alphaproteobacteria bacterium]
MTGQLAFVDSLAATAHALRSCPEAHRITDNPMLAGDPGLPAPVEDIDTAISQTQANRLATAALHIATGIDRRLVSAHIDRRPGLMPGHLRLAGVTSRLLSSLFYRAAVMANFLRDRPAARLHLVIGDNPRFDPLQPFHLPYLASPLRPLAEAGFFAGMDVPLTLQPAPDLTSINDTATDDVIGRMALLPLPVILFDLAHRLSLPLPGPRGAIFVLGENDTLREALPGLATRGFAIRRLGRLQTARVGNLASDHAAAGFAEPPPHDAEIFALLQPWLGQVIKELGPFDGEQSAALTQVTLQHLSAGMARLVVQIPQIQDRLRAALAGAGNPIILSNGLFGPVGAQIYGACKSLGATIVDFEHGTAVGLSAASQERIEFGEIATCDILICCTDQSRRSFSAASKARDKSLVVVGVADAERRIMRMSLQRRRARRRVPARFRGNNTIMHVSTLLWGGNMRATIDPPTESRIWQIDRTLIEDVYQRLDKPVLFKPYPTRRFPHHPGYATLLPDVTNVAFLKDEDFRYLRALPALIVSGSPTGTLGWCLGADRPLVYLGSRVMNTVLDDRLLQQFEAAFLYIDLDQVDWADRLYQLLQRPLAQITELWTAKAAARARLADDALRGPAHPGRHAARLVAAIARRQVTGTIRHAAEKVTG